MLLQASKSDIIKYLILAKIASAIGYFEKYGYLYSYSIYNTKPFFIAGSNAMPNEQ